jgi:hypothetical protein
MTQESVWEYAAAKRGDYLRADRKEKKRILDEFCQTTGYHRKSAIRLLRHAPKEQGKRRGRRREYGGEVAAALQVAWEATDCICSKRLAPFLPELAPLLERHGELVLSAQTRAQLLRISPSTIDRLLARYRGRGGQRGRSTTRPTSALQELIPVRSYAQKWHSRLGEIEVDLVAHCGRSTEGFYLCTLVAVELTTGWTECVAVWGKGQSRVGAGVERVRRRVPFKIISLHSDNGSEFINQLLYAYCQREKIAFSRSRASKKNDQAHVEQRNWSAVRRLVGYERYTSHAAHQQLNKLYELLREQLNFFQPLRKLIPGERVDGKVHKRYDVAQTPYQRLLRQGVADEGERQRLAEQYQSLNPVKLRVQIDEMLRLLWQMAKPDPRTAREVAAWAAEEAAQAKSMRIATKTQGNSISEASPSPLR